MRRKINLEERIKQASDKLILVPMDEIDSRIAVTKPCYIDFKKVFNNDNPLELEIGCGQGGFLTEKAKLYPNVNYIGVELISNVLITALESSDTNLPNLKFINCGAEYLLRYFPDNSVSKLYLNFSVPYPRSTNANKRLTHKNFLKIYNKIIVNNGKIEQKTDNKDLYDYSLESYENYGFKVIYKTEDLYSINKPDNVRSEYEKKFLAQGKHIYYIEAVNAK